MASRKWPVRHKNGKTRNKGDTAGGCAAAAGAGDTRAGAPERAPLGFERAPPENCLGALGDFGAALPVRAAGLTNVTGLPAAPFDNAGLVAAPPPPVAAGLTAGLAAAPFDIAGLTAAPTEAVGLTNDTGLAAAARPVTAGLTTTTAGRATVAAGLTARAAAPPAVGFADSPDVELDFICALVAIITAKTRLGKLFNTRKSAQLGF